MTSFQETSSAQCGNLPGCTAAQQHSLADTTPGLLLRDRLPAPAALIKTAEVLKKKKKDLQRREHRFSKTPACERPTSRQSRLSDSPKIRHFKQNKQD